MTRGVCRIQVVGGDTYTYDNEAISVHTREVANDIGTFTIVFPGKQGVDDYLFDEIELHDKVNFYFGHDVVSATPDFAGKVLKISNRMTDAGLLRTIEGKSLGWVLEQRQKRNKNWIGDWASTIATEIATDLSLGTTEIQDDLTTRISEYINTKTESYFDLLARVSDYWSSAAHQVKCDFYVDVDNNLVWHNRPIRTSGVSTVELGINLMDYAIDYDSSSVKNRIRVYGIAGTSRPADKDTYTETADIGNWTALNGTVDTTNAAFKVGLVSVVGLTGVAAALSRFCRDFDPPDIIHTRDINKINFWQYPSADASSTDLYLRAPDNSHYFRAQTSVTLPLTAGWSFVSVNLGTNYEYDAATNPNGTWTNVGGNWMDIQRLEFYYFWSTNNHNVLIDALHFTPERFSGTAEDATSQTAYGIREAEYIDESLGSDVHCASRAQSYLYQLKDPVTRLDLYCVGDTNLLVGDRLSVTLAPEGLSNASFDVVSVEHTLDSNGFRTKASTVDSGNTRRLPPFTPQDAIRSLAQTLKATARGVQVVK